VVPKLRRWLFLVVVASTSLLAGASPPEGENCDLASPPADAGEAHSHVAGAGVIGWIYPRLSTLPASYSGCQVLWYMGPKQLQRSMLFLRNGRVQSIFPEPMVPLCKVGEKTMDTGCAPRQRAMLVSFPAGCWARAKAEGKLPGDCLADFRREFAIHDTLFE